MNQHLVTFSKYMYVEPNFVIVVIILFAMNFFNFGMISASFRVFKKRTIPKAVPNHQENYKAREYGDIF